MGHVAFGLSILSTTHALLDNTSWLNSGNSQKLLAFNVELSGSVGRAVDCGSKVFQLESHSWQSGF